MLYTHNKTGVQYRTLFKAFDTERQCPSVVYMQVATGAIFVRDEKDFAFKFTQIGDPQQNIVPHERGPEQVFREYAAQIRVITNSAKDKHKHEHALKLLNDNNWSTIRAVPEDRREDFVKAVDTLTDMPSPIDPLAETTGEDYACS